MRDLDDGAPRLRRLGLTIPEPFDSPEHRLYELLRSAHGDGAHSQYNALIRRLVSYERSAALYSKALAKLDRSHPHDVEDVQAMLDRGLVEAEQVRACFEEIEPELYRFPAVDPAGFRASVEGFVRGET
jgi:hypothetical protein